MQSNTSVAHKIMKIRSYRTIHALHIALLINLILTVPAISQSKGLSTGRKGTGASSTGGIPVGTWVSNSGSTDNWTLRGVVQTTLTISADGTARYRTTVDIQYKGGNSIGPQAKTTGALVPMKLVGRTHLRMTIVNSGNKVKRVGNDLYVYSSGNDQMLSSECDPPGLTFDDVKFLSDAGAAKMKQKRASEQTMAVLIYHIQGDSLVCELRDPPTRQVFQRVSSR
jgi:hypothetical protein